MRSYGDKATLGLREHLKFLRSLRTQQYTKNISIIVAWHNKKPYEVYKGRKPTLVIFISNKVLSWFSTWEINWASLNLMTIYLQNILLYPRLIGCTTWEERKVVEATNNITFDKSQIEPTNNSMKSWNLASRWRQISRRILWLNIRWNLTKN